MIRPGQAVRLFHISWTLLRHGLDEVILATHLFRPLRFLLYLTPWYWLRRPLPPRSMRIRMALEDLGPIFVKFGQILSTRKDLLPDDIADELAKLQDQVPPFDPRQARRIVEQTLGQAVETLFSQFESEPLASASVAQVHGARTLDGRDVVVKVLRPGIDKVIKRDVGLLYVLADMAEKYWREGRRLRPRAVVAEYEKTILDELDLIREAANASQLRRNFAHSEDLYVPAVEWDLCRKNVMVMERIHGVPVSDVDRLRAQGIDLKTLSERGVEIFFTQVFRDNFFHADMHPGNIFVSPEGRYIAVDFGIMGTLTPSDQRYLAENFLAFFNRDYRRVAELHVESEWVPPGTRIDELEAAIRTVSEPIFQRPLKEISFGRFLLSLFQTARRFNMEVQPQLVLLQKTVLNIEGLGRQLYPDLDLWTTAKPFLERWMSNQVGPKAFVRRVKAEIPHWSERLPDVPRLLHRTLSEMAGGRFEVRWRSEELQSLAVRIERSSRRSALSIAGAAFLVSGSLLLALGGGSIAGRNEDLVLIAGLGLALAGLAVLLRCMIAPRF